MTDLIAEIKAKLIDRQDKIDEHKKIHADALAAQAKADMEKRKKQREETAKDMSGDAS